MSRPYNQSYRPEAEMIYATVTTTFFYELLESVHCLKKGEFDWIPLTQVFLLGSSMVHMMYQFGKFVWHCGTVGATRLWFDTAGNGPNPIAAVLPAPSPRSPNPKNRRKKAKRRRKAKARR